MKTQYRKKISKKKLYKEFVRVLNGLLQLSDREAEVLSLLMGIDAEWRPVLSVSGEKDILSTDSRKALMKETRINKNNLSRYIRTLKEKGLIAGNKETGYTVNPMFMPKSTAGIVEIIFILDFNE